MSWTIIIAFIATFAARDIFLWIIGYKSYDIRKKPYKAWVFDSLTVGLPVILIYRWTNDMAMTLDVILVDTITYGLGIGIAILLLRLTSRKAT